MRVGNAAYVVFPTLRPDVDIHAWRASLVAMLSLTPSSVFITHFGVKVPGMSHLRLCADELEAWVDCGRRTFTSGASDERRAQRFSEAIRRKLDERVGLEEVRDIDQLVSFREAWYGLAQSLNPSAIVPDARVSFPVK
jgi:hypothetical protein